MRNGQNKRMRGRNRNKGHHGGGHHHNPLTRVYESNGPDVKIRGTAHHVAEKYLQLARDAQSAGDPVTAENYFQHAEHYFRLIAAAQEQFRQQNPYYQAPQVGGQGAGEEAFGGEEDDGGQPQPMQGQPSQNQPNFGGQPNFANPQPYPPREQPQPYRDAQPHYQGRQQHQQPFSNPQQPYQQPQPEVNDADRLPSFITGSQQQPVAQGFGPNGDDSNQGAGERFPRHRRRRHRSAPRSDMAGAGQEMGGGEGLEPGNG